MFAVNPQIKNVSVVQETFKIIETRQKRLGPFSRDFNLLERKPSIIGGDDFN